MALGPTSRVKPVTKQTFGRAHLEPLVKPYQTGPKPPALALLNLLACLLPPRPNPPFLSPAAVGTDLRRLADHGRLLRGVRGNAGVGGLRPVRAPRCVLHLRDPPPFRHGRQEVLHLQDRLPLRLRHQGSSL